MSYPRLRLFEYILGADPSIYPIDVSRIGSYTLLRNTIVPFCPNYINFALDPANDRKLRKLQQHWRRVLIRRRTRPKAEINYAIYSRPGRGVGWFAFCRDVGLDPDAYDHARYDLKPI